MVDITKLLKAGCIATYATTQNDNYICVINAKDVSFVIPFIKTGKDAYAFIDVATLSEYAKISQIIDAIFDNALYKGMYKYKPIKSAAPEHDKTVTKYLSIKGSAKSAAADAALKAAGYDISQLDSCGTVIKSKRNYSVLVTSDSEAADIVAENKAYMTKHEATLSKTPLELQMVYKAIESGKTNGLILTGPTGTGKSFDVRLIADTMSAPYLNIQMTAGTTVDDIMGCFIPDDSGTSKFKFVPGPGLKAYKDGYVLIIEEANYGSPGVMACLNQLTDLTSSITINGVTYKRHPNFVACMTMNPGYEGTEVLNMALKNRFAIIDIPALTSAEYTKRAQIYSKQQGHELPAGFFQKLYAFSNTIEKEASSSRWHENVKFSIRNCQRLIDIILEKKCSFDEFRAAVATQYLNALSLDNDNSEKLNEYKASDDVKHAIEDLYTDYDYCEVVCVENTEELDSFFSEEEPVTAEEKGKKSKRDLATDLFSKFGD